jgi:hypothetical protein
MDKKQTILLCAFRYALGRKTYIASELVEKEYNGNYKSSHERTVPIDLCRSRKRR